MIFAYAIFGIFISFGIFAEISLFIPRNVELNNVSIKVLDRDGLSLDLGLHPEIERVDDFVELLASIGIDGGSDARDKTNHKRCKRNAEIFDYVVCRLHHDRFEIWWEIILWTLLWYGAGVAAANDAVEKPIPSRQGGDMGILRPVPESKQLILECPGGSFLYGNFSKFFQGVFLQPQRKDKRLRAFAEVDRWVSRAPIKTRFFGDIKCKLTCIKNRNLRVKALKRVL